MRILITGSRGFVGGSVGRFAARAGHEVLGVGRATQSDPAWPGAYAQADVVSSDLSALVRDFAPDAVLHAAGTASVGASFSAPTDDLRAALLSFANTLEGVRRSASRPLVLFPSSAAVYGRPAQLPAPEDTPLQPISPYGFHKAACELLAREYAECFGMSVVVCRLFSVFGEGQRRLLVWELYRQLASPSPTVWLEGTGAETRDYLHIDDAADALLRLIDGRVRRPEPESNAGPLIVNVASGEEMNVLELARRMRQLVAPEKEVHCRGLERPGDPGRWRADITRLRALAPGWEPQTFERRLEQCVNAWRARAAAGEHG